MPGMEFTTSHGTGNDFVVLPDLDGSLEPLSDELVRALCDRRRGVGADGVLRLGRAGDDADVVMDHRNADGSRPEMCGNGVRVVAKHVVDHGLVTPQDGVIRVATRAGVKPVRVHLGEDGSVTEVTVDMGSPILAPDQVPFETQEPDASLQAVEVEDGLVELSVVSMGNPHGVVVVDDVSTAPVETLGPRLETHQRFPAKANIGFAQVLDRHTIRLRVWERGVGETAACGTGACAAVVALERLGFVDDEVVVRVPGGELRVSHTAAGSVTLTGPAVEIAHGVLDEAWLRMARRGELEV
jgi:diaminopimelate epimerase